MYSITRVDALRAIPDFPVHTTLESRFFFNNRYTDILGYARINRRLEDNKIMSAVSTRPFPSDVL